MLQSNQGNHESNQATVIQEIADAQVKQKTTKVKSAKNPSAKSQVETKQKSAAAIKSVQSSSSKAPPLPNPKASGASVGISDLRLNKLAYGETFSVKKLLVSVPVKKPAKSVFFRVRDGEAWEFAGLVLERKEENESYLVTREIAEIVPGMVRAVMLHMAVDRKGNPLLIPIPLPDESGRRNVWHESLLQAVNMAKENWVRVVANMAAGSNDVLVAQNVPDEPQWPSQSMEQLVDIGFRGKIITDVTHPLIQGLLGLA